MLTSKMTAMSDTYDKTIAEFEAPHGAESLHADLYGLIGHPLQHSFSQNYFRRKFARQGIDADYVNFDIDTAERLRSIVAEHPNLRGLNVTHPYKRDVMPLLDSISPLAREIGAVNVIVVTRSDDGRVTLTGHNTDCPGFADCLEDFAIRPIALSAELEPDNAECERALVLGTGGASRAVCVALRVHGIEPTLVSRNAAEGRITYADLTPEVMSAHRLIVNTTPLGTFPDIDSCPPIPYNLLTSRHICVDIVYNPSVTKFMRHAADAGCAVRNGLHMLKAQAELSWKLWNGEHIG